MSFDREALAVALAYFDEGEPDGYAELETILASWLFWISVGSAVGGTVGYAIRKFLQ